MSKFYGVWAGRETGVFTDWDKVRKLVHGFPGAVYKKIEAADAAEAARRFKELAPSMLGEAPADPSAAASAPADGPPNRRILTVDGAYNGRQMEFRAVWHPDGEEAFRSKVYQGGTNNIAEFLGLVAALSWLAKRGHELEVLTDSATSMAWFRNRKANTQAAESGRMTEEVAGLIAAAEEHLRRNGAAMDGARVRKWDTRRWGEIPADFGRK